MSAGPGTGPPPDLVLHRFGAAGPARRLPGGQGRTFAAGDVVLRPLAGGVADEQEARWIAEVVAAVVEDGFRVPRPVRAEADAEPDSEADAEAGAGRAGAPGRAAGSDWVVHGWTAWTRVAGEHRLRDAPWPQALGVADRFTAALRGVPRPPLLARRGHVFAVADRVAWGEQELPGGSEDAAGAPLLPVLSELRGMLRPVAAPAQLVHADLAGNLLWADGLAPAVIDFSPAWRPAGWCSALVVVDAVLWYGASPALADAVPELDQLLARALVFRLVVDALLSAAGGGGSQLARDLRAAEPLVDRLRGALSRGGTAPG